MKRIIALIAAGVMAAVLLCAAGCNRGSAQQDIDVNLPTTYEADITFGVMDDPREVEVANYYISAFNKVYPKIHITVERMTTNIASLYATNTLQDVVHTGSVTSLARRGVFQSLSPYMEASGFDTSLYYDSMIKIGQYNGEQYMLPRDYNKIAVVYNTDLFDAAKVAYPEDDWTWDEFVQTCADLKAGLTAAGYTDVYAVDAMMVWEPVYYAVGVGFGGEWFDTDGTALFENLEDGLTELQQLYQKGYAVNPITKTQNIFLFGKAAMWILSRPSVYNCASMPDLNFDFAAFPELPTATTGAGCTGYAINNRSSDKNAAWAFIEFIMSEDGMEAFSQTGAAVPSMISLAEDPEATWTEYPDPFLNHQAFVLYPGRDFVPPYADYYDDAYSTDINNTLLNLLDNVIQLKYGGPDDDYATLEELITGKAAEINRIQEG